MKKAKTKTQAFLIHLAISLVVVTSILLALLFIWYPEQSFFAEKGMRALGTLALVDIVMGPCLTLVVFKPGKKHLVFDLSVIAVLQVAALCYGIFVLYAERPLLFIFDTEKMYILNQSALEENEITLEEIKQYGDDFPVHIQIKLPDDPDQAIQERIMAMMPVTPPLRFTKKFWQPMKDREMVLKTARTREAMLAAMPEDHDLFEQGSAERDKSLLWLPLVSRAGNWMAAVDPVSGKFVDLIPSEHPKQDHDLAEQMERFKAIKAKQRETEEGAAAEGESVDAAQEPAQENGEEQTP